MAIAALDIFFAALEARLSAATHNPLVYPDRAQSILPSDGVHRSFSNPNGADQSFQATFVPDR